MKKLLALLLVLCLVFAFAACGKKDSGDSDKESDTKTEQKVDKEDKEDEEEEEEEEEEFSIIGTWDVTFDISDLVWDTLMSELDDEEAENVKSFMKKGELEYVMTFKFGKDTWTAGTDSTQVEMLVEDLMKWFDFEAMIDSYAEEMGMTYDEFMEALEAEEDYSEEELNSMLVDLVLDNIGISLEDFEASSSEKMEYELDGNKLYSWEIGEDKNDDEYGKIEIINSKKFKLYNEVLDLEVIYTKR